MITLDIETTGLDPVKNSIVSIGAIDFDSGETFYRECQIRPNTLVDEFALKVNGFSLEQISAISKKPYPYEIVSEFIDWVQKFNDKLLSGQQVGSFDIPFIRYEFDNYLRPQVWPFGHRSVDLHSIAFAKFKESLSLDGILRELGLYPEPKPHHALTGATLERRAFQLLLS